MISITAPTAPRELVVTVGNGNVTLVWNAPTSTDGSPITDYKIEYKLSDTGVSRATNDIAIDFVFLTPAFAQTLSEWTTFYDGISTITNATVTGLVNNKSYDFRVTPINAAGEGMAQSRIVTGTPATFLSAPVAPTSLSASLGNTQVLLTW